MADLTGAVWHKSTRSGNGECVEVAGNLPGIVALRDSKDRAGTTLVFGHAEWEAFLTGVRAGEFDL
ncbi:DUF397 domain-containing protein [Actinoplanes couchii]|uniref:DUF397 domain-containing protein n=1 Tax=Actinoplanes couchii TaxID=403638 RepID=A0ABQ3X3W4_9ACTN|nr:DUF397 domain-containing protein [Actinoplanes couchii]MDR6326437.1 hypothetical protein [Actinoplanes couchii]GID53211.1 hypothetical protein Aco03nite_016150 [Actinoplanes couchii]